MYEVEYGPKRVRARYSDSEGKIQTITLYEAQEPVSTPQHTPRPSLEFTPLKQENQMIQISLRDRFYWHYAENYPVKAIRGISLENAREVEVIWGGQEERVSQVLEWATKALFSWDLATLIIDLLQGEVTFGARLIGGTFPFTALEEIPELLEEYLRFGSFLKRRYSANLSIWNGKLVIQRGSYNQIRIILPLSQAWKLSENIGAIMGQLKQLRDFTGGSVEWEDMRFLRVDTQGLRLTLDLEEKRVREALISSDSWEGFVRALELAKLLSSNASCEWPREIEQLARRLSPKNF